MSKHFIFSDTHHGSEKVVDYLGKKAGKDKIAVSSTGDFCVYEAKKGAPSELKHGFTDAYKKGDKVGMKKYEASWSKEIVAPQTIKSGEKLQKLKGQLKGGKVNSIYGNSDYTVGGFAKKHTGVGTSGLLGGEKSAVNFYSDVIVKKDGNTTFVYLPHDSRIDSKYKGKSAAAVEAELLKDPNYKDRLDRIKRDVNRYNSDNIVVLMHESPKPERWYGKGTAKTKSRLPDALKVHYDSVLEKVVENNSGKNVHLFHGHLHESEKKHYQYKGVKTRLLDIGDVVSYDTEKGTYRTKKVA